MSDFACPNHVPDWNRPSRRYTLVNPFEPPETAKYRPEISLSHLEMSIHLAILRHLTVILATLGSDNTAICHIDESIGGYPDLNTYRNYP